MKTVYYKTKAIVCGNLLSDTDTKLYNYKLSAKEINKDAINSKTGFNVDGFNYEPIQFFFNCLMTKDNNTLMYESIEQIDYGQIEISNKSNEQDPINIIRKHPVILHDILNMEKYLRLLFNIPISFRIIVIKMYNENKKPTKTLHYYRNNQYNLQSFPCINIAEFNNNKRLKISKDILDQANTRAKRAIDFYSSSFESENQSVRFILMFSAIETLFCRKNKKDIEDRIAKCASHLLHSNDNKEKTETANLVKTLYGKRSRYIHGNTGSKITNEDESSLRALTRKILLAYIMYSFQNSKSLTQIAKALEEGEQIGIQTRLFTVALNANSFKEQQEDLINEVETEYGQIPDATKRAILSKVIDP